MTTKELHQISKMGAPWMNMESENQDEEIILKTCLERVITNCKSVDVNQLRKEVVERLQAMKPPKPPAMKSSSSSETGVPRGRKTAAPLSSIVEKQQDLSRLQDEHTEPSVEDAKMEADFLHLLLEKRAIPEPMLPIKMSGALMIMFNYHFGMVCVNDHRGNLVLDMWQNGKGEARKLEMMEGVGRGFNEKCCLPLVGESQDGCRHIFDVSSILHLPAFTMMRYDRYLLKVSQLLGFDAAPLFTRGDKMTASLFMLRVIARKGETEREVVQRMVRISDMLKSMEQDARSLCRSQPVSVFNRVKLAYDFLMNEETITWSQGMYCLSLLWLGVELGMFPGWNTKALKMLLMTMGNFHIKYLYAYPKKNVNTDRVRALAIQEMLKT